MSGKDEREQEKRRFKLIEKGKIIDDPSLPVLKGKQAGKTSFSNENYRIDKCVGEVNINQHKQFSNLYVKKLPCKTLSSIVCDGGDDVRWYPPKEGEYANDLLSFRAICGSQTIENDFVWIMNKRVCNLEIFFRANGPI
ncbi:hypothetical protein PVK06_039283 [Gossypium arboreum]|uniref:Uncharacterized protein n=1 Tax=Gossypium arboreum TaxID=29729 RepID=A0ABR0N585_GOSAR|nr:hypothetical protein PVK06_039283 [Gossypium arboreum]